jgi:hypothetical protein
MKRWKVKDNSNNLNINQSFRLGVSFGNSYYAVDGVNQQTSTNAAKIFAAVIRAAGSIIAAVIRTDSNQTDTFTTANWSKVDILTS